VAVAHQSGSSVNSPLRLSKAGNATLRAKLYMAAIVAAQYNPDVNALYQRLLAKGKSKMSALGACMRKLIHICFGVLKHQTEYSPQVA
jgi:transposase